MFQVTELIVIDQEINDDLLEPSTTANNNNDLAIKKNNNKNNNNLSHIMHSTLTADTLVQENKVSDKERLYNKKIGRLERRKKKEALLRFVKKKFPKKRKFAGYVSTKKKKSPIPGSGMINEHSIRTHHEEIFESYLKLLALPYHINHIFCFNCSNFYNYGDQIAIPRKCQVCRQFFHPGYSDKKEKKDDYAMRISSMSRPDFILDFNTPEMKDKYHKDCFAHKIDKIKEYQADYLSKVSIIRIDGSIHQKQTQMIKDYHQYQNFCERGVKVFIVQNDDIDELLEEKGDAGVAMLKLCHEIGKATVDPKLYLKYSKSAEFRSRVRKPF